MAFTRRAQLLMDPNDFRQLRALARQRKTSVAELIRLAVHAVYFTPPEAERKAIVDEISKMAIPGVSWRRVRKEIEAGRADLP